MVDYIPPLIAFALGVAGVWLKTRRESKEGILNQPTAGGWVVLAFMAASLAVGVYQQRAKQDGARRDREADKEHYEQQIAIAKQQLGTTQAAARATASSFRTQLDLATGQLTFLRRLFLLQYELSGIEVSFHVSERTLDALVKSINESAGQKPSTDFNYLTTALRHGRIDVSQTTRSHSVVRIILNRPLGMLVRRLSEDGTEWRALERAVQAYLGERFEVQIAPGVFLADLTKRHWPCGLTIASGVMTFRIDRPGVRLEELTNASVVFWTSNLEERPAAVRLTSRDSRVTFDRTFPLSWRRIVTVSMTDADESRTEIATYSAGPYRFPITSALPEVDVVSHTAQ